MILFQKLRYHTLTSDTRLFSLVLFGFTVRILSYDVTFMKETYIWFWSFLFLAFATVIPLGWRCILSFFLFSFASHIYYGASSIFAEDTLLLFLCFHFISLQELVAQNWAANAWWSFDFEQHAFKYIANISKPYVAGYFLFLKHHQSFLSVLNIYYSDSVKLNKH